MSINDPTTFLAPGQPYVVDGLDWSWAFVAFREIPGFPGYAVGSNGTIWSRKSQEPSSHHGGRFIPVLLDHWVEVSLQVRHSGHLAFHLWKDGKSYLKTVHRAVLQVFRGDRPGEVSRHFPDRDPTNNHLRNLLWGTCQDNADDRKVHGTQFRGTSTPGVKLNEQNVLEIRRLRGTGLTYDQLAVIFDVNRATIAQVVTRATWNWM